MAISDFHKKVLKGEVCPYCKSGTGIVSISEVSDITVGSLTYFACLNYPKCDSYTVSKQTSFKPLGRLANKALRFERTRAYKHFNILNSDFKLSKDDLYQQLSEHLNIPLIYTHIVYLSYDKCVALTGWCIRQRLKLEYERTGVYVNMSARREVDGKQKFKRCIVVEQYSDKNYLVQFDDEQRLVVKQVRITKR